MVKLLRGIFILGVIIILIYIYNYNQIKVFRVKKVNIGSHKILNSIKITQISDFHSNHLIDMEKLQQEIKGFNPDFIVLTGDIMDYKDKELETVSKLLKTLCNLNKDIYYIKGNHETNHILYNNFKNIMKKLGIIILEDDADTVVINENNINIVGLSFAPDSENHNTISKYMDITEDLNPEYYNLLLIHSPNNIGHLLNGKEDLILSGHTHGGQFRLPLIGPIVAPGQGLFPRLDKGLFEINNSILYIDSGLGNSVAPIRGFNPVQFTNITIEPGNILD